LRKERCSQTNKREGEKESKKQIKGERKNFWRNTYEAELREGIIILFCCIYFGLTYSEIIHKKFLTEIT
jgi:hypothetical protein